jgi:hypothetical protein
MTMECCLAKGELLRLNGGPDGLVLRCSSGRVWLTIGDGADYLICAGSSFELPPQRTAVAEALESADFLLGEPTAHGAILHKPVISFAAC